MDNFGKPCALSTQAFVLGNQARWRDVIDIIEDCGRDLCISQRMRSMR